MIGVTFQPVVAELVKEEPSESEDVKTFREVSAPIRDLKELVLTLQSQTSSPTDTDNDGLEDTVEWAIGTDPMNPDTDFDRLTDKQEIDLLLDPLTSDSNGDHLADYLEVNNVSVDLDNDGIPNGWDRDNDDDGVPDGLDLSPMAKTQTAAVFNMTMRTSGNVTYMAMQIRPSDPEHLKLTLMKWDWPKDKEGQMRDLDNSVEDVYITPMLELQTNIEHNQTQLLDYGIVVNGKTAYLPLLPVDDLGDNVAFYAKMLIPKSEAPLEFTTDMRLKWRVTAFTDSYVDSFKSSSNNKYLHVDEDGLVRANASAIGLGTQFEVIDQGDYVALKASNGRYLCVAPDGSVDANLLSVDKSSKFELKASKGTVTLKNQGNGKYLSVLANGSLAADATKAGTAQKFVQVGAGIRPEATVLGVYADDFLISGMNLEENHGCKLGLYYTSNVTHMVGANMLLATDFVHNATNELSDMPAIFTAYDTVVQSKTATFEHQDLLVAAGGGQMMKDALGTLPDNMVLPVTMASEGTYSVLEMSASQPGSYILGSVLDVDITDVPKYTSRSLRTGWYDTNTDRTLELGPVMEEVMSWGLDNDTLLTVLSMVVAWHAGEYAIKEEDGEPVEPTMPEDVTEIRDLVKNVTKASVKLIGTALTTVRAFIVLYRSYKMFWAITSFQRMGGTTSTVSFTSVASSEYETVAMTKTGNMGKINQGMKIMKWIGIFVAVGLAIYTFVAIANAYGWTPSGTMFALIYSLSTLAWTLLLVTLASVGGIYLAVPIGLFALADFLVWVFTGKSVSDMLIDKVVGYFMKTFTKMKARTKVDLNVANIAVNIDDNDNNGFDVGDTLLYEQWTEGIVKKTKYGLDYDLSQSYMKTSLYVDPPDAGKKEASPAKTTTKSTSKVKTTTYYQTISFTPDEPAINYGFTTLMKYNYKFYYNDKWWFVLCWCWMNSRESKKGSGWSDPMTTYFDIIPGSLDDFVTWDSITPLDSDGDGIRDVNETNGDPATDPMMSDTDADGLNDKYELAIGTDPTVADTDGDGLNDRYEVERGLTAVNSTTLDAGTAGDDTDLDGLTDKQEKDGWVISYEFEGKTIYALVKSDPRTNDADGDGLDDAEEYLLLLNPASNDTNGNGVPDGEDFTGTKFEYVSTLDDPPAEWAGTHPFMVETDAEGYVYVGMLNDTDVFPVKTILKYYPNGTFMADLMAPSDFHDFRVSSNGTIYIAERVMNNNLMTGVYTSDGTQIDTLLTEFVNDAGWITLDEKHQLMYVLDRFDTGGGGKVVQCNLSTGGSTLMWSDDLDMLKDDLILWGKADVDEFGSIYVPEAFTTQIIRYNFSSPERVAVNNSLANRALQIDKDGNIFFANETRIFKTYPNWTEVASFGTPGTGNDQFANISDIVLWKQYMYVADNVNNRVQKLRHLGNIAKPNVTYDFTDSDGDGLTDDDERAGWTATVSTITGTVSYKVTSDILVADTDNDGLSDRDERIYGTDPRAVDSDGDGISDGNEAKGIKGRALGRVILTNLTKADSDGDGLGDGVEVTFGSDPTTNSSDDDGLTDYEEFMLGSNPLSNDTDGDGLGDLLEVNFGSSLVLGDEDGDGAGDILEYELGTDPVSNDTDADGLNDNEEHIFGTDPLLNDTDNDGLLDGFEWDNFLNATNNDTDGDGLSDLEELKRGLDPFSNDTDGDGIFDIFDDDYMQQLDGDIILVMDPALASEAFVEDLSRTANVVNVTPQDLLENRTSSTNIVIVGRPDAVNGTPGTAGGIMRDLLNDSGEELDDMIDGMWGHMAVRYGPWSPTQTVIMLSRVEPYDPSMVLGMLKGMRVSKTANTLQAEYLSSRYVFEMDGYDAQRTTGSQVWGGLDGNATFDLTIARYDKTDVPTALASWNGLGPNERAVGRYLDVELSDMIPTEGDTSLRSAHIELFYTTNDLDRNGDGDANDTEDFDETLLALYWYDEASNTWTRLSDSLDWVKRWGVNTTDITLFGKEYAGCVWADVTHLSMFGLSGQTVETVAPVIARAGDDVDILTGETVTLNGSLSSGNGAITNLTWRLLTGSGAVADIQYGPVFSYTFMDPGNYSVVLEVEDSIGLTGADSVKVTVRAIPIKPWVLKVGPVKDEDGVIVEGALVSITVLGTTIENTTGQDGIAYLVMQPEHIEQNVTVHIEKDGYEPVDLQTRIGRNRTLEADLPLLVKKAIDQDWTLTIGRIVNKKGIAIEGAAVTLTVGGNTYSNTTDLIGMVGFVLPISALGQDVVITVKKSGYKTVNYTTTISAAGVLGQVPPALEAIEEEEPISPMMIAAVVAVVVIVVLLLVMLTGVGKKKKKKKGKKRRSGRIKVDTPIEEEE